jgi:aspartyl-tRNA(Asn)/glutamyl-tRNA(Gln) amidotransferase subunit A
MTIVEAAAAIRRGELTPVELLEQCLARIDRLEEKVRAWAYLDREGARADAERLTAELKRGHDRGPLHGIPIGVKDIIDVFDMPTGCGSKRWATSYARRDATVVERQRQAGAVIVGKTVTTAFASFDPPPTRNPWDLSRTPGGSSSGSAAAVACGMCLGALATQTGGSITRPASYCGVCSIKPTYGRVSLDGVLPLAPSMDHMGAMANCVRDLAILLQAIAGPDPRDPGCLKEPPPELVQFSQGVANVTEGVGWLRGFFDEHAGGAVGEMMAGVSDRLLGGELPVGSIPDPPGFGGVPKWHHTVMAVEAACYHEPRLRRHPDDYPPRIRGLIEEGLACPAPEYGRAIQWQSEMVLGLEPLFQGYSAWLTPATTGPAPTAETTGNPLFNSPWSYLRAPTVSLPAAWTDGGLPLAIQLVGCPGREDTLLRTAVLCEQLLGVKKPPLPLG